MKIEVKIILKEHYKENTDIGWSLPVEIDEFILHPNDIEFEWEDGSALPYNDFIFFGGDYYYRIFINGKNASELEGLDNEDEDIEEIDFKTAETQKEKNRIMKDKINELVKETNKLKKEGK